MHKNVPIWHFHNTKMLQQVTILIRRISHQLDSQRMGRSEPSPTYNRKWTINEFGGNAETMSLFNTQLRNG